MTVDLLSNESIYPLTVLQRITHAGGLVLYRSPLLQSAKVPHAFTTRRGGVSQSPFDSLNLGQPPAPPLDHDDALRVNHELVQAALNRPEARRRWVKQVHSGDARLVDRNFVDGCPGDAMVTCEPENLLTIRVADCVPVLIATEDGQAVAAAHAGWRGVMSDIVPAAVQILLQNFRAAPTDLVAAIGPCIGPAHFEVGSEVWTRFETRFGESVLQRHSNCEKAFVDLRQAITRQLMEAGVRHQCIDQTERCTFADADDFFSHRRDNGRTGRMAAFISTRQAI